MQAKRLICISHTFVKKVNLSAFERLAEDKNFQITCIGPEIHCDNEGKKHFPDFNTQNIILDIRLLKLKFINLRFVYFANIKKIIKEVKPDLIILDNDTVTFQSLILIFYSFFYKFKISYFCNENNVQNIFRKFKLKKLIKLIILLFVNSLINFKVDKIFCLTKEVKKNYDFLGYKNKTVVMPLGYNEKIFKIYDKQIQSKFIISYFGRINPEKGIHTLLTSLENLKFDNWIFMLDIFHFKSISYFKKLKPPLKALIRKNKLKLIKCNHFDIVKYMNMSDLVIMPEEIEPQYGRVIQEAVACGTLTIASNMGGHIEIIDDPDLLFKPGDPVQLSNLINKLYLDKDFRDLKFKNLYKRITSSRSVAYQVDILKKYI